MCIHLHTYECAYIRTYTYVCSVFVFSHGAVFGIWSANASVGNIIGAFLVSGLNL